MPTYIQMLYRVRQSDIVAAYIGVALGRMSNARIVIIKYNDETKRRNDINIRKSIHSNLR